MRKFRDFSYKKICVMLTLCNVAFACGALAEEPSSDGSSTTKTLCTEGYYLSRCGQNVALGTNWLKGISSSTSSDGAQTTAITITTRDYYSDAKSVSDITHITNLRIFFEATQDLTVYTKNEGRKQIPASTYKNDKNNMLSKICTDNTGSLIGIECEKCPDNASVPASTVDLDANGKPLLQSWNVHTIADCYVKEFSDNTGTYKYVSSSGEETLPAQKCYYSRNVPGDSLNTLNTNNNDSGN